MDNRHVNALVTGASRGIGVWIGRKLLESGARLIGTTRRSEFPNEFTSDGNFEGIEVDLSDRSLMRERLKPLFDRKDRPGVVINNAGINVACDMGENDDRWLENWDRTLQVNLRAPALISKWALESWSEGEGGLIINIASRAAYRGDTQEYASYAASKGGLVAFTKSIARDYGNRGISAYTVAPGFIETDMARESVEVYGEEYLTKGMAFDEITSPEEVGELVAFLSSGRVPHMTGSTFHINGGSYMI